ncbi:glycosyltransferase [Brachyspira hyodysenteriae]|nr:glycosyltransferase [Brachyspira hyodysenteriae]MDA0062035.1 glycosyltransferase [Brachyspira hyodysenteriae]MDA0095007.1 glycosyltransferase [Brachyspira hyodysenteriae]
MMLILFFYSVRIIISKDFENEFTKRAGRAKNIKILFTFDESLAHRLTAGSDMYLMPSRFEPCGLNQIYSMKYGSIPIVHAVGGLKDTVINYSGNKSVNKATGFVFDEYSVKSFVDTMDLAFDIYYNKKDVWDKLIFNAMSKDYSLHKTVLEYTKLYKKLLNTEK